ncbi:MAG: NRDE family protein [Planctomycetota bacterium]
MCTLTWTHRVEGGASSYRLWFNRDELRTRGPEVPPREAEAGSGVRYLSPADSDAGGTWIAVNEHGVTVALLNGYRETRGPTPPEWRSRGLLVRDLADLTSAEAAWGRLAPRDLAPYRPSVVAVVDPSGRALLARWDGLDLAIDPVAERQLPIVSSSYEQDEVQRSRRALYDDLVGRSESPPPPERLERYQSHVGVDGPSAFTPSMSRPDAATRSQCLVEVTPSSVSIAYAAGAPHETQREPPVTLDRAS